VDESSINPLTMYSGRKITASLGNVTVRGEKLWKGQGGSTITKSVPSMYSITENIYYSQLSSVAILLQPEPVSHRIIQGKDWVLYPYVLSSCGLPLPSTCLLVTVNEARSYLRPLYYILRRQRASVSEELTQMIAGITHHGNKQNDIYKYNKNSPTTHLWRRGGRRCITPTHS
jgi:hypothetical protein